MDSSKSSKSKAKKYDILYVRLETQQKKIIRKLAKDNMMTMSQFIKLILVSVADKQINMEIINASKGS